MSRHQKGTPSMEEILDLLNDLIEWNAYVGQFEGEVWTRAEKIRDRIPVIPVKVRS